MLGYLLALDAGQKEWTGTGFWRMRRTASGTVVRAGFNAGTVAPELARA